MADDLVLLGLASHVEARIWRDALAQEAIPVLIRQADPLAPTGFAPALGDVQVYVRAADEKRARWIIGEAVEPDGHSTHTTLAADDQPARRRPGR
ncbi:MAG: DUF2007 domain-containing protein [Dehalococcoidia bacterium]